MLPNTSPLSLTKILTGISKSLNIAKEVIPIYQEFKPMVSKVKNISSLIKDTRNNQASNSNSIKKENKKTINNLVNSQNNPTFFI